MKTKVIDLSATLGGGGGDAAGTPNDDDDGDHGDNKYAKIKHQQQHFRRTVVVVVTVALGLLGILHYYTNSEGKTYEQLLMNAAADEYKYGKNKIRQKLIKESGPSEQELEDVFRKLDSEVRTIKSTGIIMESDEHSKDVTGKLQKAARDLMLKRYGSPPYRIQMDIEFQDGQIEVVDGDKSASLLIEMAPIDLIPYSVFNFLEIARGYTSGGFHRNAGHVLQAAIKTNYVKEPLAFQEYSPKFPHVKGTVGYCGRPSGVCWYVSIRDNTKNHGPGSQQKKNPYEADANWGTVIEGMDDVVPRIHESMIKNKFLNNKKDWVLVKAMHILVPDGDGGGFKEWHDVPKNE